jgi:hypothetical protein
MSPILLANVIQLLKKVTSFTYTNFFALESDRIYSVLGEFMTPSYRIRLEKNAHINKNNNFIKCILTTFRISVANSEIREFGNEANTNSWSVLSQIVLHAI